MGLQIAFSLTALAYAVVTGGFSGFDTDFGDIIAGSFRNPFFLQQDTANKSFAFLMILLLYLYKATYKDNARYFIVIPSAALIFLASVTHLTLIAALMLIISRARFDRYAFGSLIIFCFLLYAYKEIQPINYSLIIERGELALVAMSSFSNLQFIGDKGVFVVNLANDIANSGFRFFTVGFGHASYASRAALLLSGAFGGEVFVEPSKEMLGNVYPLMQEFLSKELWERGAFFFPYNGLFSLVMELGFFGSVCYLVCMVRAFFGMESARSSVFYLGFILAASLVDHYLEYFAPIAVFLVFYLATNKKIQEE